MNDDILLELIICSRPVDLELLFNELWNEIFPGYDYSNWKIISGKKESTLSNEDTKIKKIIVYYLNIFKRVFDYDDWFLSLKPMDYYSAYHLANNLNRRSCTYCNRSYTTTRESRERGKLMRPQFDHWLPKSHYPVFGLSFYNLIPSCNICNSSSKGSEVLSTITDIHPYNDPEQTEQFTFNYKYFSLIDKYWIYLQPKDPLDKKAINTLRKLEIDIMYNAHHPELDDLIKLEKAYSKRYIETLKTSFPDANLTNEEIYRLAFGIEMENKNFHKRPMSKFKSDILKDLGII